MCFYFLCYWWLQNPGTSYFNGLSDEDINWSGHRYVDMFTGKGKIITVMSDGALLTHASYTDRAIENQFENIFTGALQNITLNPQNNTIATASLGLAAAKKNFNENYTGIASDANVASFFFSNSSNYHEHPQTVICHRSQEWDIAILQYQVTNCEGRFCRYIEPDVLPKEIANDCLYKPSEDNWQHPIVVPAGSDHTSDILFSPPGRWPLIFSVSGVSNRGLPLNHGTEGAGIFIACPCADMAPLPTASSTGDNDQYDNYTSTNASASLFAGALAVLMEANPSLTLADLFYVTAMTADKTYPESLNWEKNAFGVNFNRRTGFGRLNLGRAVDLALNFSSTGNISEWSQKKQLDLVMEHGDYNITFNVDGDDMKSVISINLELQARKLSFGSLNSHVISPSGTVSEVKILTEGDKALDIRSMEFPSYKFLGENPRGTWTVTFKETDNANRGVITNAALHIYYTKTAPNSNQINQRDGANPYSRIPSKVTFLSEAPVPFVAGTKWEIGVRVPDEIKGISYLVYLEDSTGKNRVKLKAYYNSDYTKITLSYVPSVFKTGINISFVVDSIDPTYGYTSSIQLNYTNPYPVGILIPKDGSSISIDDRDLEIQYSLNLDYLSDDGYSTSAAITILSAYSNIILDRTWMRNLGKTTYVDAVPSDRSFLFQVSPSSSDRFEQFEPMTVRVYVKEAPGKYVPQTLKFTLYVMTWVIVLSVIAVIILIIKFGCWTARMSA
ncbi:hypothetical protein TVAG_456780 [Trichomonas vaginalis G3]|uniref:P/Homo B domain-containing protein n=1 Tax=Trichomonas vaginalis (strain ATCC PRA-98 / G3) TaxID=412133 RepID=A2DC02_TRIV3|nr:serine-type endopeptidase protein [Trichomonas vaginalis G3]EAY22043.1 hypothetical protein TVAG_456780 [Trichomonas vaginalis G3]KAI5525332.1 serine-type endopeptidase protein [Trichomonas vaginalis G3]|eukprot:XP_001583029.1 hypothetical protein [Trichomonas vaginalis G3]